MGSVQILLFLPREPAVTPHLSARKAAHAIAIMAMYWNRTTVCQVCTAFCTSIRTVPPETYPEQGASSPRRP